MILKKIMFLRLVVILAVLEFLRLCFFLIDGQFSIGLVLGLLFFVVSYFSILRNRKFLVNVPVRSRNGMLFLMIAFFSVPVQIMYISCQMYYYVKNGVFPMELISFSTYVFDLFEMVYNILIPNSTSCTEGSNTQHMSDLEWLHQRSLRIIFSGTCAGLVTFGTYKITRSDLFIVMWLRCQGVKKLPCETVATKVKDFGNFSYSLPLNQRTNWPVIGDIVRAGNLPAQVPTHVPFHVPGVLEGLFISACVFFYEKDSYSGLLTLKNHVGEHYYDGLSAYYHFCILKEDGDSWRAKYWASSSTE